MPQSGDGDFWPTEDGDGAAATGQKSQPPAPQWPAAEPKDSQAGGYSEQNSGLRAGGDQRTVALPVQEVAEVSEASATDSDTASDANSADSRRDEEPEPDDGQETSELEVPSDSDDEPEAAPAADQETSELEVPEPPGDEGETDSDDGLAAAEEVSQPEAPESSSGWWGEQPATEAGADTEVESAAGQETNQLEVPESASSWWNDQSSGGQQQSDSRDWPSESPSATSTEPPATPRPDPHDQRADYFAIPAADEADTPEESGADEEEPAERPSDEHSAPPDDSKPAQRPDHFDDQRLDQRDGWSADERPDQRPDQRWDQGPDQRPDPRTEHRSDPRSDHRSDRRSDQGLDQRLDQRSEPRSDQRPDQRFDHGPGQRSDHRADNRLDQQRPGGWPERLDPRQGHRPEARRPDQQRTLPVSWPVSELEQSPQPPPRRVPPPTSRAEATTVMPAVPARGAGEETTFLSAAAAPARPRSEAWPPPEPPRAAPRRVGPQPDDDLEPEPAPRRRSRRPVLITLIALVAVVGLAAGVVFLVPGLSDRLGLTSAGPVATAPPPAPVTFSPGLRAPDAAAPAPSPAGVAAALAGPTGESGLGNLTGVVLDPASGQTLWESGANTPLVPASTTKLLTAAAALLSLDPTEELVTKVVEGATPGEVIIVGGGDLTVSSLEPGQESVYPGAAYLSDLVEQVRASGVPVSSVKVDLTLYQGESLAPGWLPEDINAGSVGYITRMAPVMLDGDRADDPTNVDGVRTGNPGRHMAEAFADRIGASVPGTVETTAPADARVLGEIRSAPLVELVYNMLTTSDNMLAEVVAHEVARGAGEEVSFAGGAKATMDLLRQNGFNVDGAELSDGSGMSTQNQVPARLLAEILSVAAAPDGDDPRTAKLRPLLAGLPVAGGTGTLDEAHNRFTESGTTAARGWARAKTGTLSGVNSLAGIVLDKDGRLLVFALMTSDSVSETARPALDAIVAALRGCGCQ